MANAAALKLGLPSRAHSRVRRLVYRPGLNHTAHRLTGVLATVAPGAALSLDSKLPFAGRWPVSVGDGRRFSVIVDETSHPSTFDLCRKGFLGSEREARSVFKSLLVDAHTVIDIGANIGAYTMAAAVLKPSAEVIAFEPFPPVFDRLRANCALNELDHVICVHAAVGDCAGTQRLIAPAIGLSTTASSETSHRLRHEWARERGPYVYQWVPKVDIDSFVSEAKISSVELVKIDAELAELDVIVGMSAVLEEFRPNLICELFPTSWSGRDSAKAIEALLGPLGYNFYLLAEGACVHKQHLVDDGSHFNFLLTSFSPRRLEGFVDLTVSEE